MAAGPEQKKELRSPKLPSRSKKEQLIDFDLDQLDKRVTVVEGNKVEVKNYTEAKILLSVNDLTPDTYTSDGVTELTNNTGNTFQVKRESAGRYLLKIADAVLPLNKIWWNMPVMGGEEANIAKLNARPIAFNNETYLRIYVWNNANLFSDFIIDYGEGGWLPIEIQIFD